MITLCKSTVGCIADVAGMVTSSVLFSFNINLGLRYDACSGSQFIPWNDTVFNQ